MKRKRRRLFSLRAFAVVARRPLSLPVFAVVVSINGAKKWCFLKLILIQLDHPRTLAEAAAAAVPRAVRETKVLVESDKTLHEWLAGPPMVQQESS